MLASRRPLATSASLPALHPSPTSRRCPSPSSVLTHTLDHKCLAPPSPLVIHRAADCNAAVSSHMLVKNEAKKSDTTRHMTPQSSLQKLMHLDGAKCSFTRSGMGSPPRSAMQAMRPVAVLPSASPRRRMQKAHRAVGAPAQSWATMGA
jgi:hypothetical protein